MHKITIEVLEEYDATSVVLAINEMMDSEIFINAVRYGCEEVTDQDEIKQFVEMVKTALVDRKVKH